MARRTLLKGLAAVFALLFGIVYVTQVLAQEPAQEKSPLLEDRYETWYEPAQSPQHAQEPFFDQSRVPAQPDDRLYYPGDFATVVYQTFINGNWDIYKLDKLSSTTPVPLITSGNADVLPRLNTQKNRVVFATNRDGQYEIYSCDLSGGDVRGLSAHPDSDSLPTWSPDGSLIAFTSDRDRNPEIYIMNADGSNQRRLTDYPGADLDPVFSPDGSQIAWVRVVTDIYGEIMIMNADGSNQQFAGLSFPFIRTPAWSPDGRALIAELDGNGDGWLDIGYFVKPAGIWQDLFFLNGEYLIDRTMGSWISTTRFLSAKVYYGVINGYLAIVNTTFQEHGRTGEFVIPWGFYPWGEGDTKPPFTRMQRLPRYTKLPDPGVSWWAMDRGPAGLLSFGIKYSLSLDETYWVETGADGNARSMDVGLTGELIPGSTIYYKMKGIDNADNDSDYPNVPYETFTTFYNYDLVSRALDLRGFPLGGVEFETTAKYVDQPPTRQDGYAQGRYVSEGVGIAALGGDGTSHLQETSLYLPEVDSFNWLLGSTVNYLNNGNFELGTLAPWTASGPAKPVLQLPPIESGISTYLPKLGQVNVSVGEELIHPQTTNYGGFGFLARASDGTIYAFWEDMIPFVGDPDPNSPNLFYSARSSSGTWSPPQVLNPDSDLGVFWHSQVLFDSTGALHLVWVESDLGVSHVRTRRLSTAGIWSAVETVLPPTSYEIHRMKLRIDTADTLHLVMLADATLRYTAKPVSGSWSTPVVLTDAVSPGEFDLAVDPAGGVHAIFYQQPGLLQHRGKPAGGAWQALETLITDLHGGMALEIDSANRWHLLYTNLIDTMDAQVLYKMRASNGVWGTPLRLDDPLVKNYISNLDLVLQPDGDLWVSWEKPSSSLIRLLHQGVWTPELVTPITPEPWSTIFDGENGVLSFGNTTPGPVLRHTSLPENASGGISQVVTIPSDLHEPTLALDAYSESYNQGGEFNILVNNTQVYSTTAASNTWQSLWVDMTDWLGEQVTVTLRVENPSLADALMVAVDDINLGAWKTQVVSAITPDELPPANQGQVLTLTGENFFGTPQVWLGTYQLSNVQVVNAITLRATIPVRIPVGRYNLRVFHTGEVQNTIFNAVLVGMEVFIPAAMK